MLPAFIASDSLATASFNNTPELDKRLCCSSPQLLFLSRPYATSQYPVFVLFLFPDPLSFALQLKVDVFALVFLCTSALLSFFLPPKYFWHLLYALLALQSNAGVTAA